jgi:hypothetical protein
MKLPNVPKEVLKKVEELAKIVAKKKMAASISISEDESEEEEEVDVHEDYEDDHEDDVEERDHGDGILSALDNLLEDWDIRDPDEDAGRYYQELKEVYEKHKDEV